MPSEASIRVRHVRVRPRCAATEFRDTLPGALREHLLEHLQIEVDEVGELGALYQPHEVTAVHRPPSTVELLPRGRVPEREQIRPHDDKGKFAGVKDS